MCSFVVFTVHNLYPDFSFFCCRKREVVGGLVPGAPFSMEEQWRWTFVKLEDHRDHRNMEVTSSYCGWESQVLSSHEGQSSGCSPFCHIHQLEQPSPQGPFRVLLVTSNWKPTSNWFKQVKKGISHISGRPKGRQAPGRQLHFFMVDPKEQPPPGCWGWRQQVEFQSHHWQGRQMCSWLRWPRAPSWSWLWGWASLSSVGCLGGFLPTSRVRAASAPEVAGKWEGSSSQLLLKAVLGSYAAYKKCWLSLKYFKDRYFTFPKPPLAPSPMLTAWECESVGTVDLWLLFCGSHSIVILTHLPLTLLSRRSLDVLSAFLFFHQSFLFCEYWCLIY